MGMCIGGMYGGVSLYTNKTFDTFKHLIVVMCLYIYRLYTRSTKVENGIGG